MIVGGKITKVSAERNSDDIESKGLGMDVQIARIELKDRLLLLSYKYFLEYQPKKASMQIEGEIFYSGDEKTLSGLAEGWKKTKKLEPAFAEEILNAITHTGMVVGTLLSFAIGVPAPIAGQKLSVVDKPPVKKAG